jgi:hypothetical protein
MEKNIVVKVDIDGALRFVRPNVVLRVLAWRL